MNTCSISTQPDETVIEEDKSAKEKAFQKDLKVYRSNAVLDRDILTTSSVADKKRNYDQNKGGYVWSHEYVTLKGLPDMTKLATDSGNSKFPFLSTLATDTGTYAKYLFTTKIAEYSRKKDPKVPKGVPKKYTPSTVYRTMENIPNMSYFATQERETAKLSSKREEFIINGRFLFRCSVPFKEELVQAYDLKFKREISFKIQHTDREKPSIEAHVFEKFHGNRHCFQYYGSGAIDCFTYIAFDAKGKDLEQLRSLCELRPARLSISAVSRVTMQCLEAIESLHKIGYIHRNLKPSSFSVSRDNISTIYLTDFGRCRYYLNANGQVRKERKQQQFYGDETYASLNAHLRNDLSRRDDIISLVYIFYDLLIGGLPWSPNDEGTKPTEPMIVMKIWHTPRELCKDLFKMTDFVDHVDLLKYEDEPDYNFLMNCLKQFSTRHTETPFDWLTFDCRHLTHWWPPKLSF